VIQWKRAAPALAAVVVVVAAAIFTRALGTRTNYDEGVYLASLEALRHGQRLGSDLYAIQPPAFYVLLRVLAAPFGHSIEGIRAAFALVGVLGVGAAVALGWRLYGAAAGLSAGALLAIAPPYPTVAPTVAADVPSIALGICALALTAFATHPRSSRRLAAASGSVLALAVLVKFLALPFAVPILALVLAARCGRRLLPPLLGGGAAVGAVFLIAYSRALPELWQGIVSDHAGAKKVSSISRNVDWIQHLLSVHTPLGWLVPLALVALVLVPRARQTWPLWTIVPASALFLVLLRPLADHHLALLSASYAIASGPTLALAITALPRHARVGAAVLLVAMLAAGAFQEQRRLHHNDVAEPAEIRWASSVVAAATRPSELVVTDQPVIAFRARRQIPGYLSDTSNTRVVSGALTTADVLRVVDENRPTAVVVGRMFLSMSGLVPKLASRYPVHRACGRVTVYLRTPTIEALPLCPN
jgi:4-amino-4-deoxy-L-arabinose transferase-like glycosyltransferase